MRLLAVTVALFALAACGPDHLERQEQVDAALSMGDHETACLGLKAVKADLRGYTAGKLAEVKSRPVRVCLCEAIYDAETGAWDAAVATAMDGSRRDDVADCFAPALSDPRLDKPLAAVEAMGRMMAPKGFDALAALAASSDDAAVKAAALSALQPSNSHADLLMGRVGSDPAPEARAAAAAALTGNKAAVDVLAKAAADDPDGSVRTAAITSLGSLKSHWKARDTLCTAMLKDPEASARAAAVTAFAGTTDRKQAECLRAKLFEREDDAGVRTALLDAMKTSPHKVTTKALCDGIGPFLRMYVTDKYYDQVGGAEINEAQNNAHWEGSFECVKAALRQGGYSCFAKNYLGHWMKDLGGSAHAPLCD